MTRKFREVFIFWWLLAKPCKAEFFHLVLLRYQNIKTSLNLLERMIGVHNFLYFLAPSKRNYSVHSFFGSPCNGWFQGDLVLHLPGTVHKAGPNLSNRWQILSQNFWIFFSYSAIMTTDQGGLWEWYSTPALQWKGSRKRNIRRSWQRSSIRKEGFDWSWSRNVQINICEFVEIEARSDSLHLHLAFASSCCLFVRLIISDFLLRLLVFVGSPSHISSAAFSHPGQSGKATTSAADALRDRRSFGFSFSDWGTGCA